MTFRINRLALDHFRSWSQTVLDFQPGINVLVGKNGIGKTNIVEAIEFLATGSSHRASAAKYLVQRGETKATIRANVAHEKNVVVTNLDFPPKNAPNSENSALENGEYEADDSDGSPSSAADHASTRTLEVSIPSRGAIRSRIDSGPSRYFRDIVGTVRVVLFSPRDQQLISGNPSERRNFLDSAAIMMFPDYYSLIQRFRQIAKQRTAVLKRLADFTPQQREADQGMSLTELEVWTSQFIDAGMEITQRRHHVVTELQDTFAQLYDELSDGNGTARLEYQPSFSEVVATEALAEEESSVTDIVTETVTQAGGQGDFSSTFSTEVENDSLSETYKKTDRAEGDHGTDMATAKQRIASHFQRIYPGEVARGVNLIGPHRDDLLVSLDGEPAQEFASNGELWTLGLAMKMAQFNYLARQDAPILILDDVFAQLDESRRRQILDFAEQQEQVFITVAARSDIPPVEGIHCVDVEAVAGKQDEWLG